MSSYHAMDGGGDDDDADIVISEGCENIEKFTRRMHSKIALLESRDSPTLRKQIEEEHRKGQDVIAEIKAVIRRAPSSSTTARRPPPSPPCSPTSRRAESRPSK